MSEPQQSPWRAWLAARRDAYFRVVAALCLNLPLIFLALARYLDGVSAASATGAYAGLVMAGYYLLLLLILVTIAFTVLSVVPRIATAVSSVIIGGALFYFVFDSIIYRVYHFHVDAFWLQLAFTSFHGIGISPLSIAIGAGIVMAVAGVEWLLFRLARRIPRPGVLAATVSAVAIVSYLTSQAVHVIAYEKNDTRFTNVTSQLPFYYPIKSHSDAVKYAHFLPMIAETPAMAGEVTSTNFTYPLRDVPCAPVDVKQRPNIVMILLESWRFDEMNESVSPNMYAFAQRSSNFLNHFSSANCTPTGVFPLFYGIHPTYWTDVKAHAAAINNPVLIDALQRNGYAFGIFADSHFERHKIKDTVFRGIDVDETFAGKSADQKDRDLTNKLIAFTHAQRRAGKPYFAFAFYKSTHFTYYYPKEAARFLPAHKLNIAVADKKRDPTEFLNDYRNSVHYTDDLVGEVLSDLEKTGALENTIVVITSDHGEEFNDNQENYWGHTSNFTGYQTRVPMIVYMPGKAPREVHEATAHVDLPPTLLIEGLGCGQDVDAYSNGRDLFGPLDGERPMVVTSYVNHAVIMGDNVYSVFPMYVQKYKLWDIKEKAGAPQPELARLAMEGMSRFYGGGTRAASAAISARPTQSTN